MEKDLAAVIEKYRMHFQFLGVEISDVNQHGAFHDRMLHFAAELGDTKDIDVLVSSGADANAAGDLGNTPLHSAVRMGKVDAARRLLELGADPAIKNELDQDAIELADGRGHNNLAEMLRKVSPPRPQRLS